MCRMCSWWISLRGHPVRICLETHPWAPCLLTNRESRKSSSITPSMRSASRPWPMYLSLSARMRSLDPKTPITRPWWASKWWTPYSLRGNSSPRNGYLLTSLEEFSLKRSPPLPSRMSLGLSCSTSIRTGNRNSTMRTSLNSYLRTLTAARFALQ